MPGLLDLPLKVRRTIVRLVVEVDPPSRKVDKGLRELCPKPVNDIAVFWLRNLKLDRKWALTSPKVGFVGSPLQLVNKHIREDIDVVLRQDFAHLLRAEYHKTHGMMFDLGLDVCNFATHAIQHLALHSGPPSARCSLSGPKLPTNVPISQALVFQRFPALETLTLDINIFLVNGDIPVLLGEILKFFMAFRHISTIVCLQSGGHGHQHLDDIMIALKWQDFGIFGDLKRLDVDQSRHYYYYECTPN